jgi:hypothetical protein
MAASCVTSPWSAAQRWTLCHVYDISPSNIARAEALGMTLGVHGAAM